MSRIAIPIAETIIPIVLEVDFTAFTSIVFVLTLLKRFRITNKKEKWF
jgi:hypothetical protein